MSLMDKIELTLIAATERWVETPEELFIHPKLFDLIKNKIGLQEPQSLSVSAMMQTHQYLSILPVHNRMNLDNYGQRKRTGEMKVFVDGNLTEDQIIFRSGAITQVFILLDEKNTFKKVDKFKKKRLIRVRTNKITGSKSKEVKNGSI